MQHRSYNIPQEGKHYDHDDCQQPDGVVLRLLENFDQTVDEGGQPQKPFEERCEHDGAHDGDIDDLPGVKSCPASKYQSRINSHHSLATDR